MHESSYSSLKELSGSMSDIASMHTDDYEHSACQIPMDIAPPSPREFRDRLTRVPFLFTSLAKQAFQTSSRRIPRPGSADPGMESTGRIEGSLPSSPIGRKQGGGVQENSLRQSKNGRESGRTSAPPMAMTDDSQAAGMSKAASKSVALSFQKSMRRKGVLKKGPEVFAMEAEQRALETEQKLIEKDNFERQKMDYTMYIFQLSRQFNDLKKQRLDMEKEYSTLLDKKATIDAESRGDEFRKAQQDALRIQDLEAKLEYWTQALREEEAYTKTLTHMQSRSAEEKHQRDIETAAFKKETANYEHDLHALLVRLQDAKNERDAAENQVREYFQEMELYRERREHRLGERRRLVHKMQLKEEALRRMMAEEEEVSRQRNLSSLAAGNEAVMAARAKERFRATLESGFHKIMSITGIQTVQELEESFFKREEKKREFEELLEGNKDRIDGLMDDKKALDQELLKVKFSGSANDADRDEVEEVTKKLGEVRHVMHVKKNKLAAAEALVIKARSGFEYLASKLSQIEAEKPAEDAAEDSREEAPAAEEDEDEERVREDEEEGDAEEGEGVLAEVSEEGDEPEREMEMKKADDPKVGAAAMLKTCHEKLAHVYDFLEDNSRGVPPQTKEHASEVRVSDNLLLGLVDLQNNMRIPTEPRRQRSPRREDDDAEDIEDRNTIKSKAERLVKREEKKKNQVDEFGVEIVPPPKAKGKKKKEQ